MLKKNEFIQFEAFAEITSTQGTPSNFAKTLSLWDYLGNKIDELSIFEEPSRAILILDSTTFLCAGATPGAIYFLEIKPNNFYLKKDSSPKMISKEEIMQNTSDICMV